VFGHAVPRALHQLLEIEVVAGPVATNVALSLPALDARLGGRGAQDKALAELKGKVALDVAPPLRPSRNLPAAALYSRVEHTLAS
jgi:hypothetical protein